MHHASTRSARRPPRRSTRVALSPYGIEETALTLADIRRARGGAAADSGS
jgi:hypothetical protein